MFGGNNGWQWPTGVMGDMWEWDGSAWHQITVPTMPPARGLGAMVYDASRGVCVLFGGTNNANIGLLGDVWEWNGQQWTQRTSAGGPIARRTHRMVYDEARVKMLMFGGWNGVELGDTWEYTQAGWSNVGTSVAPSARYEHGMEYDPMRQEVVMYGGLQGVQRLSDTWIWNGASWSQRSTSNVPPGRHTHGMVFSPADNGIIMFGGADQQDVALGDSWKWTGLDWQQIAVPSGGTSPSARAWITNSMVRAGSSVFLYGGWNGGSYQDAWKRGAAGWAPALSYVHSPVNGIRYALTPPMSWQQAEALAVQEGGHLATIRNAQESAWAIQTFGGSTSFWIGLNDIATEGLYVWSSGESSSYRSWGVNQPDGLQQEDVVCSYQPWGNLWGDANSTLLFPGLIELPGGPTDSLTPAALATTTPPPSLTAHTLAPLPVSGALLFGGTTAAGPQPFTYTLNGTTFTPQFPFLQPSVRSDHALLLDPVRDNNVLFGGRNPLNTALADTWTWSNNQWSLATPTTSPSPRSGHRMAFDAAAGFGLLFGGKDTAGNALNDFWAWNGTTWTQRTPSLLPPARSHHGMAYDPRRNRTVIQGGIAGTTRRDDVWEYDGANWREASAGRAPSERHGPALVRDSARNKLVLFGGRDGNGFLADTWELAAATAPGVTGQEWKPKTTTVAPSPRNSQGVAFDIARGKAIAFGGFNGSAHLGDTWLFDGVTWTQAAPATSPPPRSVPGMSYDSGRSVTVMFGGNNATPSQLNDTWEWNGVNWTQRSTATSPPARLYQAMSYDSARQRTVLFGGRSNLNTLLGDTWEFDGTDWTQVATTGPSPRQCAMLCFDPVRNETVLFGGGFNPAVSAETWVWNGTSWTQRTPATSPSARLQGAMAFDPARGKVVLYGGGSAGWASNFNDTWEWDGTNWSPTPLVRADGAWNPGARDGHTMAYDPRSERVVVHGGEGGSGCLADVWSWDGSGWTLHLPQGTAPSARRGAAMYHDAAANELRLFAGGCGTSYTNDLWSLQLPVFARSEQYGAGCVGSIGAPGLALLAPSSPVVGTTMNLQVSNVPGVFIPALGAMGTSRTSWLGLPLPFDLAPAGIPGCLLHQSAEATLALGAPNGTGVVPWPVAIPNNPLLLGSELYFQALTLELPGFPRWSSLSNGLAVRLGDR